MVPHPFVLVVYGESVAEPGGVCHKVLEGCRAPVCHRQFRAARVRHEHCEGPGATRRMRGRGSPVPEQQDFAEAPLHPPTPFPFLCPKQSAVAPVPSAFRPDLQHRKGQGSLLCMKVVLPCPDSPTTTSFMCLSVQRPSTCADPTCAELESAMGATAQEEHAPMIARSLPPGPFCGRA